MYYMNSPDKQLLGVFTPCINKFMLNFCLKSNFIKYDQFYQIKMSTYVTLNLHIIRLYLKINLVVLM
jgi:hypothetical protein